MARWDVQRTVDHQDESASAGSVCRRDNRKGMMVPNVLDDMAQLGTEGWELVNVVDRDGWIFYCFKRLAADA